MLRKIVGFFSALIVLMLACMPADFKNPLSDPTSGEVDPALPGVWMSRDKDTRQSNKNSYEMLYFISTEEKALEMILVNPNDKPAILAFKGFVTKIDDNAYLNLQYRISENIKTEEVQYSETFWIIKYQLSRDGVLTLSYLDDEKVDQLLESGVLNGEEIARTGGGTDIHITNSTAELQQLIRTTKTEELFTEHRSYRKINLDRLKYVK